MAPGDAVVMDQSPSQNSAAALQPRRFWLDCFAWFTAVLTLLLICSGGMVTSKGAGLAVPDWPTTFGYNMFFFPVSKWVGGILFEHTHRLLASAVGFFTLILAFCLWRGGARPALRWLGLVAVLAVIAQGVLGGLRVTLLKDEIGILHALLAQAFLGLMVLIALLTSNPWRRFAARYHDCACARSLWRIAVATTAAIYLQLALGATMRHQHRDLAITDFPTVYHHWWPQTDPATLARINAARDAVALSEVTAAQIWLQMAHRFGAVVIAGGVALFWVTARRDGLRPLHALSSAWLLGVVAQILLGALTIWSNKAADIATAHVAVGATLLALGVVICAFSLRLQKGYSGWPLPEQPFKSDPVAV